MDSTTFKGSFNSVEISQDEYVAGFIFSLAQRKVIQNLKSSAAEEALTVQFSDRTREQKDVIAARLYGQIEICNMLLDGSVNTPVEPS